MSLLGSLYMLHKIDDIIYKPVEDICKQTKSPLKRLEHQCDEENHQNRKSLRTTRQNIKKLSRKLDKFFK